LIREADFIIAYQVAPDAADLVYLMWDAYDDHDDDYALSHKSSMRKLAKCAPLPPERRPLDEVLANKPECPETFVSCRMYEWLSRKRSFKLSKDANDKRTGELLDVLSV
jgi:hypothetical protein